MGNKKPPYLREAFFLDGLGCGEGSGTYSNSSPGLTPKYWQIAFMTRYTLK